MKKIKIELKPFISVLFIIFFLLSIVFVKMELRRMGYIVLKANSQLIKLEDQLQFAKMSYEKITSPERIRDYAVSKLTLSEVKSGQIIQMTGEKIAIIQ